MRIIMRSEPMFCAGPVICQWYPHSIVIIIHLLGVQQVLLERLLNKNVVFGVNEEAKLGNSTARSKARIVRNELFVRKDLIMFTFRSHLHPR